MSIRRKLTLALLLLGSCSKPNEPNPLLVSDWLWAGSSGGIAGINIVPKATERVVLRFDADDRFSLSRNDTLLVSGTYRVGMVRSIYSGKDEPQVITQDVVINNAVKQNHPIITRGVISTLTTDQLLIGDNSYDGFSSSFVRVR